MLHFGIIYITIIFSIVALFLCQILFFKAKTLENIFNYLGNLITVLIAGSFLMRVVTALHLPEITNLYLVLAILILMNYEHFRRLQIIKVNPVFTLSLVIFQLFLVYLIK